MKIRKTFVKYLLVPLFCLTILIPTISIPNQPPVPKEPVAPYSDMPFIPSLS